MSDQTTHEAAEQARSQAHSITDKAVNQTEEVTEKVAEKTESGARKARSLYIAMRDSDEVQTLRRQLPAAAFGVAAAIYPPAAVGIAAERISEVAYRRLQERRARGNTPTDTV